MTKGGEGVREEEELKKVAKAGHDKFMTESDPAAITKGALLRRHSGSSDLVGIVNSMQWS